MTWWFDGQKGSTPNFSAAKMTINAKSNSEEHFHSNCYELFVVKAGEVSLIVDGTTHKLHRGDSFLIAPISKHLVFNETDQIAEITIVYSAAERNYTVVLKQL